MAFTVQPLRFSQDKPVLAVNRKFRRLGPDNHVETADLIRKIAEGQSFVLGGLCGCGKTSLLNEICFRINWQPQRVLALGPVSLQKVASGGFDSLGFELRRWFEDCVNDLPPHLDSSGVIEYPGTLDDWVPFLRTKLKHSEAESLLLLVDDLDWVSSGDRKGILGSVREFLASTTRHASLGCAGNLLEDEMGDSIFEEDERYVLPPFDSEEMAAFFAQVESVFGYQTDLSGRHEVYWWTRSVPYFVQALMLSLVALEIPSRTAITAEIINEAAERIPSELISHFAQPLNSLAGTARDDAQEFINMLVRSGSWGVDWDYSLARNLRRWGLVQRDAMDSMVWATPLLANWFQKAGPAFVRIENLPWETESIQELEDRAAALGQSRLRESVSDIHRTPTDAATQEEAVQRRLFIVNKKTFADLAKSVRVNLASEGGDYGLLQLTTESAEDLYNSLILALGSVTAGKGTSGDEGVRVGSLEDTRVEEMPPDTIVGGGLGRRVRSSGGKKRSKPRLHATPEPDGPSTSVPPPSPTAAPSRYVNLWFTKDRVDKSTIDKTFALALNKEVYLRINIGPFDIRTIMKQAKEFMSDEAFADAFPETEGKPVPLEASVFSNDFHIPEAERTQKFDLVRGQPTTPIYFHVTPRRATTATLRLCVFYRNHLLQSLSVEAPVRTRFGKSPRPQEAEVEVTFSSDFASVGELPPRGLWLGLNQNSDYTHTLNIKNSERALTRNMQDKIDNALVIAREALLKVSFAPKKDYDDNIETDAHGQPKKDYRFDKDNLPKASTDEGRIKRFREDLTTLAAAGSNLYQTIFEGVLTAEEEEHVEPIRDELKATLLDEQIIQVARLKKMEDIWPWALMYDSQIVPDSVREVCLAYRGHDGRALPYAEGVKKCRHRDPKTRRNQDKTVVCPYGFWGFKHIIEQPIQPGGKKAFTNLVFEIKIQPEPVFQMLLENTLGTIEAPHIATMKGLKFKALTTVAQFTAGLKPASEPPLPEPHVVYFFCHGKYDSFKNAYLEVGTKEALMPSELNSLNFRWKDSHALVFINGCHTAELLPKDLSSIMQPFVKAYASGIIGTEISVASHLAREFGQEFFERFLAKRFLEKDKQAGKVGQIIKDLRLDLLMKFNPLGLVYTPYCSADLHVTY